MENALVNATSGEPCKSSKSPAPMLTVWLPSPKVPGRVKASVPPSKTATPVAAIPSTVKSDACTEVNNTAVLKASVICGGAFLKEVPFAGLPDVTRKGGDVTALPKTCSTYSPWVTAAAVE